MSRSQAKYLINVAPVSPHQRQHPPFSTSEHSRTLAVLLDIYSVIKDLFVDNSMQNIFSNECQLKVLHSTKRAPLNPIVPLTSGLSIERGSFRKDVYSFRRKYDANINSTDILN